MLSAKKAREKSKIKSDIEGEKNFYTIISIINYKIEKSVKKGYKTCQCLILYRALEFVNKNKIIDYYKNLDYNISYFPHMEYPDKKMAWKGNYDLRRTIGIMFTISW